MRFIIEEDVREVRGEFIMFLHAGDVLFRIDFDAK